jgi:sulfide:quinone oxidoreductase
MAAPSRTRVVIAGNGVAGVEAMLALHDLAPEHVDVTMLAPTPTFEVRALAVATPFAATRERRHFPLQPLAQDCGARLLTTGLDAVRADDRKVVTTDGATIDYDALVVALGGRSRAVYDHAMTFGAEPLVLNGLLADIEQGYSRRIAFVVPPGVCWPLPAYELALMTRRQASGMGMSPQIAIVTPEEAPLAVFGREASDLVAGVLDAAGIELRTSIRARVGPSGRVGLDPLNETLEFQRVVALPVLDGPAIAGLPHDGNGFVPVDPHGRVDGLRDVYCAGDCTAFPIKQGGLAAQQADAVAEHIAALAGADVRAQPFRPVLRGRLLTGDADRFLSRPVHRPAGETSDEPLWSPPTKVSGKYLTPWMAGLDPALAGADPGSGGTPVETALPSDPTAARRAILSLDPLGGPIPTHRS